MTTHRSPVTMTLARAIASPDCSPTTLDGAWQIAAREKDTRLAVTLAAHPNLPAHIVALLPTHPKVQLRAAWLRRPDTDPNVAAQTLRDTRGTDLLAAVARQGLAGMPHLIAAITDRIDENTPQTLLDVLIAAPDVPLTLKATVAGKLHEPDRRYVNPHVRGAARRAGEDPAAATALLTAVAGQPRLAPWALDVLSAPGVPADVRLAVIAGLDVRARHGLSVTRLTEIVLAAPDVQPDVLATLTALASDPPVKTALRAIARYKPKTVTVKTPILTAVDRVRSEAGLEKLLSTYRNDPQLPAALAAVAAGAGVHRQTRVRALLTLAARDRARTVATLTHIGDDELTATVYTMATDLIQPENWTAFTRPETAPTVMLLSLAGTADSAWLARHTITQILNAAPDVDVLALPWPAVQAMTRPEYPASATDRVIAALAAAQAVTFTRPDHWVTWATLSSEYTGTARDLLRTATTL